MAKITNARCPHMLPMNAILLNWGISKGRLLIKLFFFRQKCLGLMLRKLSSQISRFSLLSNVGLLISFGSNEKGRQFAGARIGRVQKNRYFSFCKVAFTIFVTCGLTLSRRTMTSPRLWGLFCLIASLNHCNWAVHEFSWPLHSCQAFLGV